MQTNFNFLQPLKQKESLYHAFKANGLGFTWHYRVNKFHSWGFFSEMILHPTQQSLKTVSSHSSESTEKAHLR